MSGGVYIAECPECGGCQNQVSEVIVERTGDGTEPTAVELACGHTISLEDADGE